MASPQATIYAANRGRKVSLSSLTQNRINDDIHMNWMLPRAALAILQAWTSINSSIK